MFQDALSTVGNYAEIYDRNLAPIVARSTINQLNDGSTGRIYVYPLGNLDPRGPDLSGKLKEIKDRGYLKCGIFKVHGFGEYNAATGQWTGVDADLCRAVSAALFSGRVNNIEFIEISSGADRFLMLERGDFDLISGVTTLLVSWHNPSQSISW